MIQAGDCLSKHAEADHLTPEHSVNDMVIEHDKKQEDSMTIYRLRWRAIVLSAIVLLALGAGYQATQAQTNQRCFEETGFCIAGRIREFWEQNGGLPVFGFPTTPQQQEVIEGQSLEVQWFERNRLELHPENQRPYDVLLGRLGADDARLRNISSAQETASPGCRFFAETGYNVCGDFLAAWRANGLEFDGAPGKSEAENLSLFGLPVTGEVQTTLSDGQTYTVQWFERARFERHPENAPPYNVLLGLLGNEIHAPQQGGGRIAFFTDRDGNWEIYTMNPDGSGLANLTRHPGEDRNPAWSPDGTQIAFSSDREGDYDIYLMNADGSNLRKITSNVSWNQVPKWSPDGSRIAFVSDRQGSWDIFVMNADGSGQVGLTSSSALDTNPTWSPDGSRIAFLSERDGNAEIYIMNADGSGVARVTNHPEEDGVFDWSRDGSRLLFGSGRDGNFDIYSMNVDGTDIVRLTDNPAVDSFASWSPDGGFIVFNTERDGNAEVYVMRSDGSEPTNLSNSPGNDGMAAWGLGTGVLPPPPPDTADLPPADQCADVPAPSNASIKPANCVYKGTILQIEFTGFQPNEQVTSDVRSGGRLIGSAETSAGPSGIIRATYDTVNLSPGVWEVSVTGKSSGHQAVIHFKVVER